MLGCSAGLASLGVTCCSLWAQLYGRTHSRPLSLANQSHALASGVSQYLPRPISFDNPTHCKSALLVWTY